MTGPGLSPDAVFGRFQIQDRIGEGGMGEIYRANDTKLGRPVALKILRANLAYTADGRKRFEREARAAGALNHPNVVTIYDAGVEGATPWIAMEFVEGHTLRHLIAAGPLSSEQVIDMAIPLSGALSKAHQAGIVHRDLKPENT